MYILNTLYPYLACQSVDAKPLFGRILPQNLQDKNGSKARARVFPRPKALRRSSQWCLEKGWETDKKWSNGEEESSVPPPQREAWLPFCRSFSLTTVVGSGVTTAVE